MLEQSTLYLVTYSYDSNLESIHKMPEVRLYDSIKEAINTESNLLSFRYQVVALANKEVELGFNATPRDLVFGTQYSIGAGSTLTTLNLIEVELDIYDGLCKKPNKTLEPIYLEESDLEFLMIDDTIEFTDVHSYIDAKYTSNCYKTSGSNVKSIKVIGETLSALDENIGGLVAIHTEALEQEMLKEIAM